MGRVCCRLRLGGGYSMIRYAIMILHTQKRYFKVLFSHFIVFSVYFIILHN